VINSRSDRTLAFSAQLDATPSRSSNTDADPRRSRRQRLSVHCPHRPSRSVRPAASRTALEHREGQALLRARWSGCAGSVRQPIRRSLLSPADSRRRWGQMKTPASSSTHHRMRPQRPRAATVDGRRWSRPGVEVCTRAVRGNRWHGLDRCGVMCTRSRDSQRRYHGVRVGIDGIGMRSASDSSGNHPNSIPQCRQRRANGFFQYQVAKNGFPQFAQGQRPRWFNSKTSPTNIGGNT
jgi:hypothetical protein